MIFLTFASTETERTTALAPRVHLGALIWLV